MWSTINEVLQWVFLFFLALRYLGLRGKYLELEETKMDYSRGRDFQPREIRYR